MKYFSRLLLHTVFLVSLDACFFGLFCASSVMAQTQPSISLPESLKGIKQATGTCQRDDAAPGVGRGQIPVVRVSPDLSCAIAPLDLAGLRGRTDTVLVDARESSDYSAFHVDGVLNVAASALRTKSYLQNKIVVLIGNGKAERELYVSCAELKSRGFKQVKVLRGGMPSWTLYGQPVVGRVPDLTLSTRLDPLAFWLESEFDSNLVLVMRSRAGMQKLLRFSVPIIDATPALVKVVIERRRKELKNAPLASVILVTGSDSDAGALQTLRQSIQPIPLLIYADTQEAFERQRTQQKTMWEAHARGPKRPRCGL